MAVESTIFEHYAPVGENMRILQGNYFAEVGDELDDVAEALTATRRPLLDLLGAADEASVRTARSLVRDGFPEARDLADLAGAVRDLEVPYAAADIDARLVLVEEALAELG